MVKWTRVGKKTLLKGLDLWAFEVQMEGWGYRVMTRSISRSQGQEVRQSEDRPSTTPGFSFTNADCDFCLGSSRVHGFRA